jgi:hypothetical protein
VQFSHRLLACCRNGETASTDPVARTRYLIRRDTVENGVLRALENILPARLPGGDEISIRESRILPQNR